MARRRSRAAPGRSSSPKCRSLTTRMFAASSDIQRLYSHHALSGRLRQRITRCARVYACGKAATRNDIPCYPRCVVTQVLFILLLAASLAFFARTSWLFGRAVFSGAADPRPRLDELPARLADVGIYFFGQKKVAEEGPQHRTSKHHLFIFWGFLIITIATIEIFISGVWSSVSLQLLPAFVYEPLYFVIDVFNLI